MLAACATNEWTYSGPPAESYVTVFDVPGEALPRIDYDGTRETNYRGSLADAIASLLPPTATRSTPNRPLASMQAALTTRWLRPAATTTILSLSGSDDSSPLAPSVNASAIEATREDWYDTSGASPCWEFIEPTWCPDATRRLVFRGTRGMPGPTCRANASRYKGIPRQPQIQIANGVGAWKG